MGSGERANSPGSRGGCRVSITPLLKLVRTSLDRRGSLQLRPLSAAAYLALDQQSLPDTPENRLRLWIEQKKRQRINRNRRGHSSSLRLRTAINRKSKIENRKSRGDAAYTSLFPGCPGGRVGKPPGRGSSGGRSGIQSAGAYHTANQSSSNDRKTGAAISPGCKAHPFFALGLELAKRTNIYDLPGFREGYFEVQERQVNWLSC